MSEIDPIPFSEPAAPFPIRPPRFCAWCGRELVRVESMRLAPFDSMTGRRNSDEYDLVCPRRNHWWWIFLGCHDRYFCNERTGVVLEYSQ